VSEASFEMKGYNLIFLVTILIHNGSNEGSLHGKAAKPSAEKSSERSSETTAISSGTGSRTHPHKFLDKPSSKGEHGNIHTTRNKRKYMFLRFKRDFCESVEKMKL